MIAGSNDDGAKNAQGLMLKTDPRQILRSFEYVGSVRSMKQEYQVFSTAGGDYLVFSPSNRSSSSFHVTHVPASRVEAMNEVVKGSTTSTSLLKDKRVHEAFQIDDPVVLRFEILTTLYVMCALGLVEIAKSGRHLLFTRKGESTATDLPAELQ